MHRTLHLLPLVLLAAAVPAGAQEPIAVGQTAEGELSAADRKDSAGKIFDAWSFNARAGATYVITMRSKGFDSYLRAGPAAGGGCDPCQTDDDWVGSDARIVLDAGTGGARVIHVTTYQAGESGPYTLSVEEVEALPRPGAEPSPASRGGGVLQSGVAATGVLDDGDRRAPYNPAEQNSLYDVWTYRGRAGESLTLSLSSRDFDTFVRVYRWEGSGWRPLGSNDDEPGGSRNSRVVVTLPADGEYQVHAAAFGERATGAYTLTANDPVAAAPPPTPVEGPEYIVSGFKFIGELAVGDSVADDGTFYDGYRYNHALPDTMFLELLTAEVDAVLRIGVRENGVWREVARGVGRGSRSELAVALPRRMYEVRVGTRGPGRTGAYVLVPNYIRDARYAPLPEPTIIPGQTHSGRLEPGDSVGQTGVFEDAWTLVAEGLTTVQLRSGDFDPLVEVQARLTSGPWMTVARGDGRAGTDTRATYAVSPHIRYRVRVTAQRPGQGGAYTLVANLARDFDAGTPPAPIAAGQTVSGRLTETDSRDADGSYHDEWTFRGRPGETVTVTLRSDDFNAAVQVGRMVNGEWELLKEEDGTVDTRDAVLIVPLPEAGEYRIRAGSHRQRETGAYTLTLESPRFF
jgi:hypothetical protein